MNWKKVVYLTINLQILPRRPVILLSFYSTKLKFTFILMFLSSRLPFKKLDKFYTTFSFCPFFRVPNLGSWYSFFSISKIEGRNYGICIVSRLTPIEEPMFEGYRISLGYNDLANFIFD